MLKRKIGILLLLLSLGLSCIQCYAWAVSTEDAVVPIEPEKTCTLTISYGYDGTVFPDVPVKLYKIADVSADCRYTLTEAFAGSGLILNGIRSTGEWNVVRSTLEAYILAYDIQANRIAVTDLSGQVCWEELETGMYLAVVGEVVQGELHCYFDSALVALPGLDTDGYWQYQVAVHAKAEVMPPIEPDEKIEWKVLKLWKGDAGKNDRPKSVTVEIFRDGVSYETVILSEENHWSYTWMAKNDGASWMVVERNVPEGYTMTVETKEKTFVVTNTLDTPPSNPPGTGETINLLVPILLMSISGSVLLLLGMAGKRNEQ